MRWWIVAAALAACFARVCGGLASLCEAAAGARSSTRRLWGPFYRDAEHTDKPTAPKNPVRRRRQDKGGSRLFRWEVGDAPDKWALAGSDCERGNNGGGWASQCWAGPRGKVRVCPAGKEGARPGVGPTCRNGGKRGKRKKIPFLFLNNFFNIHFQKILKSF